ncbi:hypothetical protein JCM8547_005943 [Rhodosporidiobolus lusitaniae]
MPKQKLKGRQKAVETARAKPSKGKKKAAAPPSPSKSKSKANGQDDEEEEEEEEEAEEEEEDEGWGPLMSKEKTEQEFAFWNDVGRKPGNAAYEKAALDQLLRDYPMGSKTHIKQVFKSDQGGQFYVPTWFHLANMRRRGVLNQLKTARDLDKPIRTADGKEKARPKPPKSNLLKHEINWLYNYTHHGFKTHLPGLENAKYKKVDRKAVVDDDDEDEDSEEERRKKKKKKAKDKQKDKNRVKQSSTRAELRGDRAPAGQKRKQQQQQRWSDEDGEDACGGDRLDWEEMGRSPPRKKRKGGPGPGGFLGGGVYTSRQPSPDYQPFSGLGNRVGR